LNQQMAWCCKSTLNITSSSSQAPKDMKTSSCSASHSGQREVVVFRLEEGGGRERRWARATRDGVACQRWGCQHAAGRRRARVGRYGAIGMPLEVGGSGTGQGGWGGLVADGARLGWHSNLAGGWAGK
jgi:hypothetical protein